MKKRSLWILFITALLCLSMLFAACDSDDIEETSAVETESATETETETESESESSSETVTEPVTEEPETEARPTDKEVNYGSAIDVWEEYFTFVGKEDKNIFTSATEFLNVKFEEDLNNDGFIDTRTSVETNGQIYTVVITKYVEDPTHTITTENLYNVETGKKILTVEQKYDTENKWYSYDYEVFYYGNYISVKNTVIANAGTEEAPIWQTTETYTYYDYNGNLLAEDINTSINEAFYFNYVYGLVEYSTYRRVNTGTEEAPAYEREIKYSYYDNKGTLIAKDLDEKATFDHWSLNSGDLYAVRVADKNYYTYGGEIVFIDENPEPHKLPVIEEGSSNFEKLGEQNGYTYMFYRAWGYSSGSYSSERRIQVINTETYTVAADCSIEPYYSTAQFDIHILANGNVFINAYSECYSDNDLYDFEMYGYKMLQRCAILNIETGKVEDVEPPFVIVEMLTPESLEESGMQLKADCHYAEVLNIVDGKLSNETEFVILNNQLQKIATLPKFREDQTSFVGMLGTARFLFEVSSANGTVEFVADGEENTVEPYWNGDCKFEIANGFIVTRTNYDPIANDEVTTYIVYNYDLEKVAEFKSSEVIDHDTEKLYLAVKRQKTDDEAVVDNDKFINDNKPEYITVTDYKIAYINAKGELVVNTVSEDENIFDNIYYESSDDASNYIMYANTEIETSEGTNSVYSFYNAYGQLIHTFDSVNVKWENILEDGSIVVTDETNEGVVYYIIK